MATPQIQSRFNVSVELATDMYVEKERTPGATIVAKVLAAGEARNLAGLAISALVGGNWQSDAKLDVEPDTGRTRDSFNGRVFVVGSDDEVEYRKVQEQEAERQRRAEMVRQVRLSEDQAAAAKLTRERQAQQAAQREDARLFVEKEASAAAAATLKRLEEIESAMEDKDAKKRRIALDKALKSSDPLAQNLALREIFSRTKIFHNIIEREEDGKQFTHTIIIDTTRSKYNKEIGEYDTIVLGQQHVGPSRISGIMFGGSNLSLTLSGDAMKGFYHGISYDWRATMKLQ